MSEGPIIPDLELGKLNELLKKGADMTGHIEPYVKKILEQFREIVKKMSNDYEKAMDEIDSQDRSLGYPGELGYTPKSFDYAFGRPPGGLSLNVLNNVLANFGLFIPPATPKPNT